MSTYEGLEGIREEVHEFEKLFRERMLTKREQFAALAMVGLLAQGVRDATTRMAENAVRAADLLMAELEKPKGE
ncbi:MAG: hypothetical protein HY369_00480 [Candidatus Aenigmarchaeota archaeon]|nr:hypothetical protein [Candidatus Aenigmarchaeota archaeon]